MDTKKGRIIPDDEIKAELAAEHPYQQWLDEGTRAPRRPATAVRADADALVGRPAAAALRLHAGGPPPRHRADGAQRRRVAGVHGHRHAAPGDLRPSADALRVLQAALRPGHQPSTRRELRGSGHVALRRRSGRRRTCSSAGVRVVSSDRACRTRSSPTTSWPSLRYIDHGDCAVPGFRPVTVSCLFPVGGGSAAAERVDRAGPRRR